MLRLSWRIFTWSTAPTNHSIWRANPPTWGQIALSRCSPMRCIFLILSRVFLRFWILFPAYQTCILFGEQLDKPGANCPVTIFSCLPHTPESPDLQRQWCIRLRHLKYWTNGGIQHRPTRLICAQELWKIGKSKSLTNKLTVLVLLSEAIASRKKICIFYRIYPSCQRLGWQREMGACDNPCPPDRGDPPAKIGETHLAPGHPRIFRPYFSRFFNILLIELSTKFLMKWERDVGDRSWIRTLWVLRPKLGINDGEEGQDHLRGGGRQKVNKS